jgi:uncharacterized membrane protein
MEDLSWGTAIVGSLVFAAGLGLQELSRRANPSIQKICAVLGYLMMGFAAAVVIWNMVRPLVLAI